MLYKLTEIDCRNSKKNYIPEKPQIDFSDNFSQKEELSKFDATLKESTEDSDDEEYPQIICMDNSEETDNI